MVQYEIRLNEYSISCNAIDQDWKEYPVEENDILQLWQDNDNLE